jgi:hypothetical protein
MKEFKQLAQWKQSRTDRSGTTSGWYHK